MESKSPIVRYDDTYVVLYDFGSKAPDHDAAIQEFKILLGDLEEAGLNTEVRAGYDETLLVFVKAPGDLLGKAVHKSRVKDWLHGITPNHPGGNNDTVMDGDFEAENLLSVYHLISWPKDMGGAGITPKTGQWENVLAMFPLHNVKTNEALLRRISKQFFLKAEDLDAIRDLFGAKVAFYFAFIQVYSAFLIFPAVTGIIAWLWFPRYSLAYGILTSVWCTVFLEYWKVMEVDFSLRWDVKGVHTVKINRPQFKYDKTTIDETGQTEFYIPLWKQLVRQLLQIPFIISATLALGTAIVIVFAIEILISEAYAGPYKDYLEFLPTVLLAISLPYITSTLEGVANWITEFENYRTADSFEMALTQKIFVLNMITNYLPIFLTAFVYVPFGDSVVPRLETYMDLFLASFGQKFTHKAFIVDSNRLRSQVIALTVTGQVFSFLEENILPLVIHRISGWYRTYRERQSKVTTLRSIVPDTSDEAEFLSRCREETTLPPYNVQEDISEIVLQFGYLALFSPVWPVIPVGFLINNWIELRSDFAKICIEHQRPAPIRAGGIGPWIRSLDVLTWLGSLSTAAIVHLFGRQNGYAASWAMLPVTVFISEHVFLMLRAMIRSVLKRTGSARIRKDRNQRYANRLMYLDELESERRAKLGAGIAESDRQRRNSELATGPEIFWTKQLQAGASEEFGVRLIKSIKRTEDAKAQLSKID